MQRFMDEREKAVPLRRRDWTFKMKLIPAGRCMLKSLVSYMFRLSQTNLTLIA
jgi:hypothetical protein